MRESRITPEWWAAKGVWRCRWTEEGKRRSRTFRQKTKAEAWAKSKNAELNAPESLRVTDTDRLALARLRSACEAAAITLDRGVALAVERIEAEKKPAVTVARAVDELIRSCRQRNLREASITTHEVQLGPFVERHGDRPIAEITREELLAHIFQRYTADSSRDVCRRSLLRLFNWSGHREREWCDPSVVADLTWEHRHSDEKSVEVLTVDQADRLIRAIPARFQAAVALQLFAGIRPMEICSPEKTKAKLDWSHINPTERVINIPGAVAKTRRKRRLHDLPDNLWKWLERPGTGPVCPRNYRNWRALLKQAREEAGIDRWPKDVMRHSFGSYGFHRGVEWAIETMGHESGVRVFFRHYKGVASKADSEAYFAISP